MTERPIKRRTSGTTHGLGRTWYATRREAIRAVVWGAKGWAETEEQVHQVIDEADAEVERMLTPTVPEADDPIGRIAKWLDEAREAGYGPRDIAQMLVDGTVAHLLDETVEQGPEAMAKGLADQLDDMASSVDTIGWREVDDDL